MTGVFALLLAMIVPVAIGWGLLRLVVPGMLRRDPLTRVCVGGFLGLVLITMQMFAYSYFRMARSFWSIVLPWAVLLGAAGAARHWTAKTRYTRLKRSGRRVRGLEREPVRFEWPRLNAGDWVLLGVLLVEMFWIVTVTVNEPVWGWDAMVQWSRKAKIFYFEVRPAYANLPLQPYPLCVPLSQTWVYVCLGDWNDAVGKGIFVLPYVLGGLGFYSVLRSLTHRTWALAATAALLATPRIFFNLVEGYADSALALLYGPGVLLLCRWLVRDDWWDLIAGALCLGMTAWIKAEGLPLALIVLALTGAISLVTGRLWSRRQNAFAVPVAVALVLLAGLAWQLVVRALDLGAVHGEGVYSLENFRAQLTGERLGLITSRISHEVRQFHQWGLIWFIWPAAALLGWRRFVRPAPMLLVLIVLADFALIYAVFITTAFEVNWHLSSALERLMINLLPLLFAFTTIQAHGLFTGEGFLQRVPAAPPAE